MLEDLARLIELQRIDTAIAEKDGIIRRIPQELEAYQRELEVERNALTLLRTEAETLQKLRRTRERELEELTQNLKKKQARLFEIKTNQEYAAVLKEIEGTKEKISVAEEETLGVLERIEEVARSVAEQERRFTHCEAEHRQKRSVKESALATLEEERASLAHSREAHVQGIESDLLQMYTKLLRSRGGLAVVPVENGSCCGCHVNLTPQHSNEVSRNEKILTCRNCTRILYARRG